MIKLNDKAIAVEVLKGSVDHEIYDGSFYYVSDESYYDNPSADKRYKIDLPEGNWQILGLAHELNEEHCAEVVDIIFDTPRMYKDYMAPTPFGTDRSGMTAKESFQSLMESKGLVFENPLGVRPGSFHSHCKEEDWLHHQQKVKTYLILTL